MLPEPALRPRARTKEPSASGGVRARRRAREGKAILCLSVMFAACAEDPRAREATGDISFRGIDSAGVNIVESSEDALTTRLQWVGASPDLELGEIDAAGPTQFSRVAGVIGFPDASFVVLDAGSQELRWFDASGHHTTTMGGAGRGPGEFIDPTLVGRFDRDSLLVYDRTLRRFTMVAADGSGVRTFGQNGEQSLYAGSAIVAAGNRVLYRSSSGARGCPDNQQCEVPMLMRWIDVATGVADTLNVQHISRVITLRDGAGPGFTMAGPFDQKALAAAAPHGPVVEGSPQNELIQFSTAGDVVAVFRVLGSHQTSLSARSAPEQYAQSSPDPVRMKGLLDRLELPDVLPAFQNLRVDQVGWYWAELFQPLMEGGASDWMVFDSEGRARGIVGLPNDIVVHDIGSNYILAVWEDEHGVQFVRRYALNRGLD